MNQCKSCGTLFQTNLSSCPVCHTSLIPAPAKKTDDFTQRYNSLAGNVELIRLKSRWIAIILSIFFGSLGLPLFYLGFVRRGLLMIALNILALFFAMIVPSLFGYPWMILMALSHVGPAVFYFLNVDAKDHRGDFLK